MSHEKNTFLDDFVFIIGTGNPELGWKIITWIGENMNSNITPLHLNFDTHPDNEPNFKIVDNHKIEGKIAVIIESVYAESPDLEMNLFQLLWATKYQYKAKGIILVIPFMKYRRQDHPEKVDEIHRNRYFIHQLKNNGVDALLLCDIHSKKTLDNCAQEGLIVETVSSAYAFADQLRPQVIITRSEGREFYIFCPDEGSLSRNIILAKLLNVPVLIIFKRRLPNGQLEVYRDDERIAELSKQHGLQIFWPDAELIKNATVCLSDDEVATGRTATTTGRELLKQGAEEVEFCATHPVCTPGWKAEIINSEIFSMILFGNTIPRDYKKRTGKKVTDVSLHWILTPKLLSLMAGLKL